MIPGPALLFCPADRPDRVRKAAETADAVIVDLEDGVHPDDRPAARAGLRLLTLDPARTIVRLNPAGSEDFAADVAALGETPYRAVMLAKTESGAHVDATPPDTRVLALCETARGVAAANEIARHSRVDALMWGAEDLIASLGGTTSRGGDGRYRDVARTARSLVLLAAGAAGIAAVDAVHLDIGDSAGLEEECRDAVASGFHATACIHPTQVAVVRAAYAPSAEQLVRARALLQAAEGAAGVFRFEGTMVDEPLLRQARALIARTMLD